MKKERMSERKKVELADSNKYRQTANLPSTCTCTLHPAMSSLAVRLHLQPLAWVAVFCDSSHAARARDK